MGHDLRSGGPNRLVALFIAAAVCLTYIFLLSQKSEQDKLYFRFKSEKL
jgi:hypothetical protein